MTSAKPLKPLDAIALPRGGVLLASVAALMVLPAWAQTAAPQRAEAKAEAKGDTKADGKGDSKAEADNAAAMERARRIADNPMRLILEASRRGARGVVVTPVPDAADAASLRRTATGAESAAVAPAAVAAPAPAVAAPPPLQQLRSELAAAPVGNAEPAASATPIAPAIGPAAAVAAPTLPALASLPTTARLAATAPQLLRMVEPEIPERVIDQAGGRRDILVEFTVRPDGTTGDISLLPPSPRQFQRFVVDAVTQWRYAPMAEARKMRVQIAFSGG